MRKLRVVLFVALTCCAKSTPAPAPEPAAASTPATPVATGVQRASVEDTDAPRLSLVPPRIGFKESSTQKVSVASMQRDSDAVYVTAPINVEEMSATTRIEVGGTPYGLGVVDLAAQRLIVRFSGKDAPAEFEARWQAPFEDQRWGFTGVVHVTTPAKVPPSKTLRAKFFATLADTVRAVAVGVGDADAFYTFAAARLSLSLPGQHERGRDHMTDIDAAMAIYTGASSLHDALQTERALRVARPGKRTIPVASVNPIEATPHAWDKLLRELGGKPVIEPLAHVVPAGMLYVHAKGARALSTTVQRLTEQFSGMMRAADVDTGAGDVTDTYATQLALEHSPVTAAATDAAIDGIAIVTSDPFFREGTDVTVAFHVTNARVLELGLEAKEHAVATKLGATRSTYTIGKHEVTLTATADGTMNRHQLALSDVILVSNSRAALERFVAVHDGKAPSLASQGDFSYMRALYPYGAGGEDTFVFLGDAFIAHVVSPAFKGASARRVNAIADKQAVNYAAMLYAWLEGRAPASTDELLKSKLVQRGDHGQPISVIREVSSDGNRIAVYYAIANGTFVASLDRPTLAAQLTALRDGRSPKGAASDASDRPSTTPLTTSAQSSLDYAPKAGGWLTKIVAAFAEKIASAQAARRASADAAVRPYVRSFADQELAKTAARNLLGYLPSAPDAASNLTMLDRVKLRVSIEGSEEHRGLHVGATLAR